MLDLLICHEACHDVHAGTHAELQSEREQSERCWAEKVIAVEVGQNQGFSGCLQALTHVLQTAVSFDSIMQG